MNGLRLPAMHILSGVTGGGAHYPRKAATTRHRKVRFRLAKKLSIILKSLESYVLILVLAFPTLKENIQKLLFIKITFRNLYL